MNHLENILYLFLMIIVGFFVRKGRLLGEQARPVLNQFVLRVALPFMILDSMRFPFDVQMFKNALVMLAIAAMTFGAAIVLSELSPKLWRLPPGQMAIYHFAMVFPNTGFLGLPLLKAAFGAEGAFYGSMVHLVFTTITWTYGVYVFTREEGKQVKLKELLNPSILALLTGFVFFLLSVRLPDVIHRMTEGIGNTATPLSMLIIGMMLAEMERKEFASLGKPILLSVYRNILFPFILYFVLRQLGLTDLLLQVPVVAFGMPAAANTAIFAQGYGKDYQMAAKVVMVSTLLAVITIPLLIAFVS